MHTKSNNKSAFCRKAGLFLLLCSAYYFFISRDHGTVESSAPREWAKAPKVLSKSMTEQQLDEFPPEAFSYIAMIDVCDSCVIVSKYVCTVFVSLSSSFGLVLI